MIRAPGRDGLKTRKKCSPGLSGLHAVFRKFLREIMGGAVCAGQINFRNVPIPIGAAVSARKLQGFLSAGLLSSGYLYSVHVPSSFRKHVFHVVAHILMALYVSGPVYHLFLFRLRKAGETVHGFRIHSQLHGKSNGKFIPLYHIHHLRISMEGGDGKYAWPDSGFKRHL